MKITVFDTETTGLDSRKHEIIEMAFITYLINDDGSKKEVEKLEVKVKPENIHLAEPEALQVNGYSEEKWVNSLPFEEVYEIFYNAFQNSDLMLGQNLIFDLKFFSKECKKRDLEIPKFPPYLDSKAVADRLVREGWLRKSSMDYLCEYYKVESNGRAHTALVDCERTMKVWSKLQEDVGEEYEIYTIQRPYRRRYR